MLIGNLVCVYAGENPLKEHIAVKEFTIRGKCSTSVEVLTEIFRSELTKSNRFLVMKAGNMDSILVKNGIKKGWNCANEECFFTVGGLLGVDAIVFGTLVKLRSDFIIYVRKIETKTGILSKFYFAHGKGEEDIKLGLAQVASELSRPKEATEPIPKRKKVIIIGSSFREGIAAATTLEGIKRQKIIPPLLKIMRKI